MRLFASSRRGGWTVFSTPAGYGRFTAPILWIVHGWLALFFLAAGYAKVAHLPGGLGDVMIWPSRVPDSAVIAVGVVELCIALALLAPAWSTRGGRIAALIAAVIIILNAIGMALFYIATASSGLVVLNAALAGLGFALLRGHRPVAPVASPR